MCLNRCVALYFYAPTFHHVAKLSNKFNLSKQNLKNVKIYFKFSVCGNYFRSRRICDSGIWGNLLER